MLAGAGFCAAVFVTSVFIAAPVVFVLLGLTGPNWVLPDGSSAMLILGQLVTVLIAMAATYATFAGLRWVWRGFAAR